MKKSLLFLPFAAVILAGCGNVSEAKADEVPIGTQIQNLIKSYIDKDGQYTKKTTICFNEAAHKEMDKYFHNGAVQAKRTTYYNDKAEALLMAAPNGELDLKDKYTDSGYGGYRLDTATSKVYRFVAKNTDGTFENMFDTDYMYTKSVASYSNITHLFDAFVNLSKLAADGYFADEDWNYSKEYKQYTHDINPGDGETENNDRYYPDILGFAAPMLKSNYVGSKYLHIQSIGFSEHYDTDANKYLSIKIYLIDEDKDKLTGECGETTMSEARIYKGIRPVGEEDFTTSYFLKGTIGGEYKEIKMEKDPDNENQYYKKGLSLSKDDLLTVWSTDNGGSWHQTYEHCWTNAVQKGGDYGTDYKVLMSSNSYDIYYKTNEGKSWITANKDLMFFDANSKAWDKDGAKIVCEYFNSSDKSIKTDTLNEKVGSYYKMNIPQGATKVKFMRQGPNGEDWGGNSGKCDLSNGDVNNAFFLWEDNAWTSGWTFNTAKIGSWTNM